MAYRKVSDVMTYKVLAVRENESLAEVFQLLRQLGIRHVPVVNDEKEVVGIISERDLLRACLNDETLMIAAGDQGAYLADHPVTEIMSAEPETVEADTSLSDACQTMLDNKFDCLPVVSGQKLIGILTTTDILRETIRREIEEEE